MTFKKIKLDNKIYQLFKLQISTQANKLTIRMIRGPGMFVIKKTLEFNKFVETLCKFIIY